MGNLDEQLQYRSSGVGSLPAPAETSIADEREFSTLKQAHRLLQEGIAQLHSFDAFDLTESELKIKQQIKAHQIAADTLQPIADSVRDAIITIDSKYKG
jgi:hypothetical protein